MTLSGAVDADVRRDERLSRHTTYRIGGPAALFVAAHSYAALSRTLAVLEAEGVEWVILGKGSNLLVADDGYDGCVILLDGQFARHTISDDATMTAGAGSTACGRRTMGAGRKRQTIAPIAGPAAAT